MKSGQTISAIESTSDDQWRVILFKDGAIIRIAYFATLRGAQRVTDRHGSSFENYSTEWE